MISIIGTGENDFGIVKGIIEQRSFSTLCFILVVWLLTAIFATGNLQAEEPIKVGIFQNKPIVFFEDEPKGLFVDVLDYIAEKENWKIEYVLCELKDCINLLKSNELDLMTSVGVNPERLDFLDFSKESIWLFWGTVYSHDLTINSILDLEGRRIGVRRKNNITSSLKKLAIEFEISPHYVEFDNYESAFKAFKNKELDAIAVNNTYGFDKQKEIYVYKTPIVFNPFVSYFAAPKRGRHSDKLTIIDRYAKKLKGDRNSPFRLFRNRWFNDSQEYWTGQKVGILSAILLSFITLFMAFWRYRSIVGINEDLLNTIAERKRAEETLQQSEEKYQDLYDNSPDAYVSVDAKSRAIIECNQTLAKMTGFTKNELLGRITFDLFTTESRERAKTIGFPNFLKTGFMREFEVQMRKKDGSVFDAAINATAVRDSNGEILLSRSTWRDITDRKKVEEQIKASLKEKQTLLDEIHHRVKNNMQVINSLLKLQSNNIEDVKAKEILKDSQSRVYAMSAVHETLHGSESLSEIDLQSYLSKITTSIFQTYSTNHQKVVLKSDIDNSPISINQSYPLGLIINEIISNSLKYAFPNEREGEICVRLKKKDKELELTIMDNGIGIPDNFDWKNSNTLGLKLVRTLVENQLDGSIDMESKNGTKFTIKFNIEA